MQEARLPHSMNQLQINIYFWQDTYHDETIQTEISLNYYYFFFMGKCYFISLAHGYEWID